MKPEIVEPHSKQVEKQLLEGHRVLARRDPEQWAQGQLAAITMDLGRSDIPIDATRTVVSAVATILGEQASRITDDTRKQLEAVFQRSAEIEEVERGHSERVEADPVAWKNEVLVNLGSQTPSPEIGATLLRVISDHRGSFNDTDPVILAAESILTGWRY